MEEKMEKQIKREEIYKGRVINVVSDDVSLDDGSIAKREVVLHRGGACIALQDDDGKYFMVKQYRYPHEKEMLEFCAGKLEEGENPDDAILRESKEELGYSAKDIKKFGYIIPTCGYSSEKIYLYYGKKDKEVGQHLDKDERINVYKYSFKEIKEMIKNGTIDDAKTIALILHIEMEGIDA